MMGKLAVFPPVRFGSRWLARLRDPIGLVRRRGDDSSRQSRSRFSVCREGWYYLVLAVMVFGAAMLREVNLMLILGGMLFGPLLFNWRLTAVTLRGLDVRRRIPRGVCAGDLLVVNLELTNARRRVGSWAVTAQERIRREGNSGAELIEPTTFFPYVAAGKSAVEGYRGRLPQRGRYRWEPVRLSTRFPFGLFRREVSLGSDETLLVFPRLGRLTQGWMKRRHESFEGGHRRERRHSRVSGNFFGVREWRHGDSRRWIHWRSSARHGNLVVRQFEQHRNRDVAIVLDLWQPSDPSMRDLESVELAVSFVATVVADMCRKVGCNLLVVVPGAEPGFVGGTASAVLLQDAMARLALAEGSSDDRLPEFLDLALARIAPGTEVVVVSTRIVDLNDRRRFEAMWRDPARRRRAGYIRTVTTADGDLDQYFRPE